MATKSFELTQTMQDKRHKTSDSPNKSSKQATAIKEDDDRLFTSDRSSKAGSYNKSMGGRRDFVLNGVVYGTTFRSVKWRSLDPCGLACVSLSGFIHIFSLVTISMRFLKNSQIGIILFCVVFLPSSLMALWSLYMAWSTDPGAVPMGAKPLDHPSYQYEQPSQQTPRCDIEAGGQDDKSEYDPFSQPLTFYPPVPVVNTESLTSRLSEGTNGSVLSSNASLAAIQQHEQKIASKAVRRCRKCNDNFKPPRAHHDSVTGRCIVKMDHYCPWIGNAVGATNHKFFLLFLLYTFLCCCSAIPIIAIKFVSCNHPVDYNPNNVSIRVNMYTSCQQILTAPVMALSVATTLFFFFTLCMLADQYLAVTSNVSKIARLKIQHGGEEQAEDLQRVADDFNEMFGTNGQAAKSGFQWHWLVPLPVIFPDGVHDEILGYRIGNCEGEQPWRPCKHPTPPFVGGGALAASKATGRTDLPTKHLSSPSKAFSSDKKIGELSTPLIASEIMSENKSDFLPLEEALSEHIILHKKEKDTSEIGLTHRRSQDDVSCVTFDNASLVDRPGNVRSFTISKGEVNENSITLDQRDNTHHGEYV